MSLHSVTDSRLVSIGAVVAFMPVVMVVIIIVVALEWMWEIEKSIRQRRGGFWPTIIRTPGVGYLGGSRPHSHRISFWR
jgi:hypothetical protein